MTGRAVLGPKDENGASDLRLSTPRHIQSAGVDIAFLTARISMERLVSWFAKVGHLSLTDKLKVPHVQRTWPADFARNLCRLRGRNLDRGREAC
jgi:hypothetical protein